jgi:hypothetical protein
MKVKNLRFRCESVAAGNIDFLAVVLLGLLLGFCSVGTAAAQEAPASGNPDDLAEIGQKLNNPMADLWMLFFQHDTTFWEGDITGDHREQHNLKFQPVMPIPLNADWRLVLRPVFQFVSFETPQNVMLDFDRDTGLGDTVLLAILTPTNLPPKYVVGFGPSLIFPTASDDALGAEKWAAGPALAALYLGNPWTAGFVTQHWWSYAGEDDRSDINLTDLQYILRYRLSPTFQIGMTPNIQYNWEADSDDAWTIPVGLGFDHTTRLGKFPVRWGAEVQYYVEQPDAFGPEWGLRFFFIPVIPNPLQK